MSDPFTVRECLHGYGDDTLEAMCGQWRLAASSKTGRVKAIEKILSDTLHVRGGLAALDPAALRALHLVARNGPITAADVLSVPGLYGARQPASILQRLAESGFVLVCPHDRNGVFSLNHLIRERGNGDAGPVLFVPPTVAEHLPNLPASAPVLPPAAEQPAQADPAPSERTTFAVLELLRMIELAPPRITVTGELHKGDETRLHELRCEAGLSRETMSLALMMARQLGCIEVRRRRLSVAPKAEVWMAQSGVDRVRDLFQAYAGSPELTDLRLFFGEIFTALEEHLPVGSLRRTYHRTLAAAVLAGLAPDSWNLVDDFAQALHDTDANVLFLKERWRAIMAHAQDFRREWQERAWQAGEKRLFSWMLQTLLADFGMVEFAGQGRLFRLTPLGRYALGIGPAPSDTSEQRRDALVVQPDFEVLVYLDRCSPVLKRKLDMFCDRKRGGAVSTHFLTLESVYRGARAGIHPSVALEVLAESSARPLPGNVREQMAAWQRKMETVTVWSRCALLECPDEVEALRAAAPYPGARILGARFVQVREAVKDVPARIDYTRGRRPCLKQGHGLSLYVPWENADFFVRRQLADVGGITFNARGDLVLTLSRERLTVREDWNLIAAQLESLAEAPLAARYRVALRAWGGELQPAHSRSATVLRFEDPEVCEAILELPEAAVYVEGRLGLCALVLRPGKLAAIKKTLRAHDILVRAAESIVDTALGASASLPPPLEPAEWLSQWVRGAGRDADAPRAAPSTSADVPEPAVDEEYEPLPAYSTKVVRELLADAIVRRKPVLLEYQSVWSTRPNIRRVEPVSLDTSATRPTLSGYCHTSRSARTFQLARIAGIRILEDETF